MSADPHRLSTVDVPELWLDASTHGTPLVRPAPNGNGLFATYLWRASCPAVGHVELVGPPSAALNEVDAQYPLARVGDSDTWWATFRVQRGTVHGYGFVEYAERGGQALTDRPRRDPHARTHYPGPEADLTVPPPPDDWAPELSVADLRPHEKQGTGTTALTTVPGTVTEHAFTSRALGNTRRVWSYVPASREPRPSSSGDDDWLVLLNDGWQWRSPSPIAPILDDLIGRGVVPPLVVVMQECPPGRRGPELLGDPRFARAMAEELVPWARRTFGLTGPAATAARTIAAGQSFGGLNAAYLAMGYPEVFGHVVSQSGAFWHTRNGDENGVEWLTAQLLHSDETASPLSFYAEVGLLEGATMVDSNRRLRDALAERGVRHSYQELPADHSWISWRRSVGTALAWVTSGRTSSPVLTTH